MADSGLQENRLALEREIVDLILTSVNLHHKDPNQIHAHTVLFEDGLGLDSLDVLEIVVAVEKKYGVTVKGGDEGRQIFQTIGTLTDFVQSSK